MISVIIPTCNNESNIFQTINFIREHAYTRLLKEVIVVDSGSSDKTVSQARKAGATVIHSIKKVKAFQKNLGAKYASGKILYFVYPGAVPPVNFSNEIVRVFQNGYSFGTFSADNHDGHWIQKLVNGITNNKINFARPEGQTLFVSAELFVKSGGFKEDMSLLDHAEIIARLKRYGKFVVLNDKINVNPLATRKDLRQEVGHLLASIMYSLGCNPRQILKASRFFIQEYKSKRAQEKTIKNALGHT
jgi:glycosyltransferase involved in cell wall biosynthesis